MLKAASRGLSRQVSRGRFAEFRPVGCSASTGARPFGVAATNSEAALRGLPQGSSA